MSILPQNQVFIDSFFQVIEPLHGENPNIGFNYVAVKFGEDFHLVQGAIVYNASPIADAIRHFKSQSVRAGIYKLSDLNISVKDFVSDLLNGIVHTPDGDIVFKGNDGRHGVQYEPFHQDGTPAQARYDILSILGAPQEFVGWRTRIDWELRACETPYDSIQELASEHRVGSIKDIASVEIIAFHVIAFDYESKIAGENADLAVLLAHGLSPAKARLSYKVFSQGRVEIRSFIDGNTMQWKQTDRHQHGTIRISVPKASVLQCFVSYDGIAQHFGWVSDIENMQNPKRAVYDKFDEKLEVLRDFLTKPRSKGSDGRDLETGIAWLLWMRGFSVAHLGATSRTQDAADLIATTPIGHFAVIECTTGLLKAENKLALLVSRAEKVRTSVISSNNQHLRILPVIVTSKSRAEVNADIEQAEKLGILVITKENIEQAIQTTVFLPKADEVYNDAYQIVEANKLKYLGQ